MSKIRREADDNLANQGGAHAAVAIGGFAKSGVKAPEETRQRSLTLLSWSEKQRAQRRTEGERIESRDDHGDGHRHRKLLIHRSRNAGDENGGDENGRENKRNCDDGPLHLRHGLESRIPRRQPVLDMALNRLDDNDGIIDDKADRENQAKERERVD